MKKTIIASGGGGFTQEKTNPLFDYYVLAQAEKPNPKICFLPTASGDNLGYSLYFEKVFDQYPCQPSYLDLIEPKVANLEEYLLNQDIIYVGGGNTKSMLAVWKEWGVDKILHKAYEKGIVLAGISAGSVCWFEECLTDAIPGKFTLLRGLGFLEGSNCVHYDNNNGKREQFWTELNTGLIKPGFGVDNFVALHFLNGELYRIVASVKDAAAYESYFDEHGVAHEKQINPIYLGDEEVFQELILNSETFK